MAPDDTPIHRRSGQPGRALAALALLAGLALAASGCTREVTDAIGEALGEDQFKSPVGIGSHQDQLKLSPCACAGVEVELGRPSWAS